jgi:hypothetical protein
MSRKGPPALTMGCRVKCSYPSLMARWCLWLSTLFCHMLLSQAGVPILNATSTMTTSTSPHFDHQVILENTKDSALDDVLVFRWNSPVDGVLYLALEHTTKTESNKPSWLALGFFDAMRNTVPIFDNIMGQANGQAVIGSMFKASPAVFKYFLGDPHGRSSDTNQQVGVSVMPSNQQTLVFRNMEQGTTTLADGTRAIRTILTFAKNMNEGTANAGNEASLSEAVIRENGDNIFLWAIGPAGMEQPGMHDDCGAFRLDFQLVHVVAPLVTRAPDSAVPVPVPTPAPEAISSPTIQVNILNATESFQIIDHIDRESSPYKDFDFKVKLDTNLVFYWANQGASKHLKARLEHKSETMDTAPSWLSLGFYDVPGNPRPANNSNFVLDRSTAIIGKSWEDGETAPLIYNLGSNHAQAGVIQPLTGQSSMNASFLQFADTGERDVLTTLDFAKSLTEYHASEPPILGLGENVFLWATGPPGASSLSMHSEYGAFRLDLFSAAESLASVTTIARQPTSTPATVASVSVIDGSIQATLSTDPKFDYQVILEQEVTFRWEMPDEEAGIFTGRLEHTTKFIEAAPAWLGFGFPNPSDTSTWMLMQNTFAIMGLLPSEKVEKYSLGMNNNHTQGFVQALPLEQQTLKASKMMQVHDPDTGVYTTSLTFAKLLVEEVNPSEPQVWLRGGNRFLWAVGNALTATPTMGMHRDFGALTVDFSKVAQRIAEGSETTTQSVPQSSSNSDLAGTVNPYPAPIIVGQCYSDIFESNGKSIQLTPDLTMHWTLNNDVSEEYAEFGEVPSVTIVLQYNGVAWLGFGFQSSQQAHHPGSTAVIGFPLTKEIPQLKWNITMLSAEDTFPMPDQTLIEAYINVEEGSPGLTTLRFTKALKDGMKEVAIKPKGLNYFSFAVGAGDEMGYHRHREAFQMDLDECVDFPPEYDNAQDGNTQSNTAKGALTAHAVMAAIAWGFSMPLAVGMAWFRQLIPTTWIYIHVSFNLLTFVLTLLAVIVGVAAVSSRNTSQHFSKPHHILGVILFVAYTFQVGNGFLRPPVARKEDGSPVERKPLSLKKPESPREWWHMIHRATGIIMLIGGIFQIASGMQLFDENFESGRDNFFWYWTYVSLFALAMIALRIWLIMQNRRARGEGTTWMEDRAATSVGIDPSGMRGRGDEDCVVLEIPSRSGDSSTIRARIQSSQADVSESNDDDNMTVEIT